MSQSCSIKKCTRASRWLCDCCQQNLCLQHLNEHNASLISQLNPLTDEINALEYRLKTLDIQKPIVHSRQKLEEWRDDCHQKIDSFFEQKCQELDQLVNEKVDQQREELNRINLQITELIHAQETTPQDIDLLRSTIRQLKTNMKKIEQTCFTIDIHPLLIDETLVFINKKIERELDLSTLSPAYSIIPRSEGSFPSLTNNDRYLLMHQKPNLCFFDYEMNMVKQVLWSYGSIHDMCWSSALDRFIVLGKNNIYLVNDYTMTIDNVHTIEERHWGSCTCSDTILFASTNECPSSVLEFTLLPAIQLIREWKYPVTCTKDQCIADTVYNDGYLALLVMSESTKSVRMELRNAKTLDPMWAIKLDTMCLQKVAFRCCAITFNEWLIVDYETERLVQITKDGKIKKTVQYDSTPCRAVLFDLNTLAVLTVDDARLHTVQ
ncbi:unnamed protein product [Rotaria sp. Silwood2]|nr:unnamed protein product [Rotaria sp. Silwood2]